MSELEIWNELGNIYYNSGAYDEAIRAYHRAIELDNCCGQSFSNLASIYIHKKFFAEAILMYHKGIELLQHPSEKATLWNRLGDVYLLLDAYDNALKAYQMAVDLDPENETFETDLAKVTLAPARRPAALAPANSQPDVLPDLVQLEPAPVETPAAEAAVVDAEDAPVSTLLSEELQNEAETVQESVWLPLNSFAVETPVVLQPQEDPAPAPNLNVGEQVVVENMEASPKSTGPRHGRTANSPVSRNARLFPPSWSLPQSRQRQEVCAALPRTSRALRGQTAGSPARRGLRLRRTGRERKWG